MTYFKTLSKQAGEAAFLVKQSRSCLFPSTHFKLICSLSIVYLINAISTGRRQSDVAVREFKTSDSDLLSVISRIGICSILRSLSKIFEIYIANSQPSF